MRSWTANDAAELFDRPARRDDAFTEHHEPYATPAGPLAQFVRLPRWRRYAACKGRSDVFYANGPISEAMAVEGLRRLGSESCLDEALAAETGATYRFGIVAGYTPSERVALCQ